MVIAGINADYRTIPDGAPVTGYAQRMRFDKVVMAGGSVLASGVARSGAGPKGVVNVWTEGVLWLEDWSKVTGEKNLSVNSLYRTTDVQGMLSVSGTGQIIGVAVSGQELCLQIQLGGEAVTASASSLQTEIDALDTRVTTLENETITATKLTKTLLLCAAYTPAVLGPDSAQLPVPYGAVGETLTWTVKRLIFRVGVAGGAPSVKFQSYNGTGAFSTAYDLGTTTITAGEYEQALNPSGVAVKSGDKVRFNVLVLGTATNWMCAVELTQS